MSYTPIDWVQHKTPINETNLDRMEKGIADAHEGVEANSERIRQIAEEQIPEEYLQKSVDDYIAKNQSGLATKTDVSNLDSKLSSDIVDLNKFENSYMVSMGIDLKGNKLSGTFISEVNAVYTIAVNEFYTISYPVKKGCKYIINGEQVRLSASYPIAIFNDVDNSVTADAGTPLLFADTTPKDYYLEYVPQENGYITIAGHEIFNGLSVSATNELDLKGTIKRDVKIQIFGDSISDNTWGDHTTWVNHIKDCMSDYNVTIVNSAVGGKPLANWNEESVSYLINDGVTLQNDNDIIIIFAGTNDWGGSVKLGEFGDTETTEPTTENTFSGGLNRVINYLSNNTKAIPIFVTPIQRYSSAESTRPTNEKGEPLHLDKTLRDFCDREIEICEFYAMPCLDLYAISGINRLNIGQYTTDGLHTNDVGDIRIATIICNFIKQYI